VRTNDGDVIAMSNAISPEAVKSVVSAASVLNHLRNNRIEYLALTILLHLVGATNYAFDKVSGTCI
jgi:3,4-dihydroxy-2-butanone 4-phosphate synthase